MIDCPIRYQGSKRKLIPNILALAPKTRTFIDMFGGSGIVSANMNQKNRVYNELDDRIVGMVSLFKQSPETLIRSVKKVVKKYDLNKNNLDGFLKLRKDHNRSPSALTLFVLHRHSHSNLIRHNQSGQYNANFGKRGIDLWQLEQEIYQYHYAMKDVEISNMDFCECLKDRKKLLVPSTLIYFDPPYLASGAMQYAGAWSEDNELQLLHCMSVLKKNNVPFMLSNVLEHRGMENTLLKKWIRKNRPTVEHLNMSYKFARAYDQSDNETDEILLLS